MSDLKDVQQAYQLGDIKAAQNSIIKGYFGVFEGKKMEAAMRMEIGAKHTYGVERMFGQLRKLTKKEDSAAEIARMITAMTQVLVDDASILDKAGIPPEVFRVNQ
ncbi:MAG: hypothetical protein PSN46_07505 [Gammaproteobacteria bacterium]|nr:hypothetical protein [Gammaproteobacteria bacterium]